MAVIIENFTEPATCWSCPFLTEQEWLCIPANRHVYNIEQPRPSWCPVRSAPEEQDNGR